MKNYYSKHKPVVLQNGINHWPALKKWSPQYFAEVLGATDIQVQFDRESDALFIPIGCWHCVEGLDKSISISFTNFNAPNSYAEGFKKAQG
ncbi:cupin-like domain-containing protein [Psychrobacter celer]|uniref:cupin-like domain-containing protein n=1 Tax=Psychrobacter celer TaxID=306572 RepID=UPI002FE457F7